MRDLTPDDRRIIARACQQSVAAERDLARQLRILDRPEKARIADERAAQLKRLAQELRP